MPKKRTLDLTAAKGMRLHVCPGDNYWHIHIFGGHPCEMRPSYIDIPQREMHRLADFVQQCINDEGYTFVNTCMDCKHSNGNQCMHPFNTTPSGFHLRIDVSSKTCEKFEAIPDDPQ